MAFIMKSWLSILWVMLFGYTLLAVDYQVKTVKILPAESYPARTELGGVTIAANPYSTNKKSFTAFDIKNLNSRGYFPLHVIIWNQSSIFLTLRTRNVILITSSGQQLYTTPAAVVVDDVVKDGIEGRSLSSEKNDQLPISKSGSPLADFTNKELANKLVEPGSVADGFLFFFTSDPKRNPFAGSTLFIPKLEEEGTHKALGPFSIPLDPALPKAKNNMP
jgi:hypothetical protein